LAAVISTWNRPSQKMFPLAQTMSRKADRRDPDFDVQAVSVSIKVMKTALLMAKARLLNDQPTTFVTHAGKPPRYSSAMCSAKAAGNNQIKRRNG